MYNYPTVYVDFCKGATKDTDGSTYIRVDPGQRRRNARRRNALKLVTQLKWGYHNSGYGGLYCSDFSRFSENWQLLIDGSEDNILDQYELKCYAKDQDNYDGRRRR